MRALQVFAGSRARKRLRERGLSANDIRIIPAAAGGPKGLVLNHLDRYLFGQWLPQGDQPVHLMGSSIGAWRLATACLTNPETALARLAHDYIHERYDHLPGKAPTASHVTETISARLAEHFDGREREILLHPRFRLHVFTSRGRCLLRREGRFRTPLGYIGAFATNAVSRRALGAWLERVVFSDQREDPPLGLHDYRTRFVCLDTVNLVSSLLASCSIPFWLDAVHDIPGAPSGAYWDGGITDYHLHLDYASMADDIVLYPHFQQSIVPGWFDKPFRHRHGATDSLANVVVLAPTPEWIASLPNSKLPDRRDFKAYLHNESDREAIWSRVVAEGARLADEFAALVDRGTSIEAQPL